MAVNTNINVPFNPQEGITGQILTAIQLANEEHYRQQQLLQQAPLVQAQTAASRATTAETQQKVAANLPAAQVAAEQAATTASQARTNQSNIETQIAKENNPLIQEQLRGQARNENATASVNEAKAAMYTSTSAGDISSSVDKAIPADKYPELNKRTHASMEAAQKLAIIDPEGPTRALAAGIAEINGIERETNPQVIQARVSQAVQTQRALYGGNDATAGVAPKLIETATAQATKFSTAYSTINSQLKYLRDTIQAGATGDQVAAALTPVVSTLASNSFYGTHRYSPAEQNVLSSLGSLGRQIETRVTKIGAGTLPPDTTKEFLGLVDRLSNNSRTAYENSLKGLNADYRSKFQPLDFNDSGGAQSSGNTISLQDFLNEK